MAKIGLSLINPETHFKYNELDYKKGSWEIYYSNRVNIAGTKDIDTTKIKIGLRNTYDVNRVLQSPLDLKNWFDLSGNDFNTLGDLLSHIVPIINFNSDTSIRLTQRVTSFGGLVSGTQLGDLAYVEESEGTSWLPSTLGGTYYPKGWYIWDGSEWVSDRGAIANQLEQNVLNIQNKSDVGHIHTKSDIIDFNDTDYATSIQGLNADTAFSWGDHSTQGYLTSFTETDPIFQVSEASNFITGDKTNLDNQSGVNSGDETTFTIQSKRPLKAIEGQSIEGFGNISLNSSDVGLGNVPNVDATDADNIDDSTTINKFATQGELSQIANNQNNISQEILDRQNEDGIINNDLQQLKIELPLYVSNNSGQIKLNWAVGTEPSTVAGFSANVAKPIILNNNYIVSSFPTTTYPYLANTVIGGENVINPSTLFLRELKEGQNILFRVKVGYLNKGVGQNGRFSVRMYNPNPSSSFEIIKSLPTPDGTTTLEQELEFIAIADSLSLDVGYGYAFEVQSTFNDGNMVGYISNITAFYLATDLFNK